MTMKNNNTNVKKKISIRFAIIIPIYNTEKYLRECLDSLLAQTYKNFVAFLIDDGSTDTSGIIAELYASRDARLNVIHTKNNGVSNARNIALEMIEKEGGFDYILFLDSDDRWVPHCLKVIEENLAFCLDAMMVYGVQNFDKDGLYIDKVKQKHEPLYFGNERALDFLFNSYDLEFITSPAATLFIGNVVVPASKVRGLRFNTALKSGEDQEYKLLSILRVNSLIVISDLLLQYRLRKGSLSHSGRFEFADENFFSALSKLIPDASQGVLRAMERRFAEVWWKGLRSAVQVGDLEQNWTEFSCTLQFMKQNFRTGILKDTKYRKRIVIFSLGKFVTKAYFWLKRKRYVSVDMSSYFD